jgi:prepilin-type N-terminal cleavage/methylation domain-containing protein
MVHKKQKTGFTLIEILVVIGIIAILAAIVIVAINPARQFAQARNTQRESDVSTILNAVGQLMVDNKGNALSSSNCSGIGNVPDSTVRNIGNGGGSSVNLTCLVPTYIASSMPFDPDGGSLSNTQYTITASSTGRYEICAPKHAETAISGSANYCLMR